MTLPPDCLAAFIASAVRCGTVYHSMQVGEDVCPAEDIRGEDGAYLYVLAIEDIPAQAGKVTFEVTPYGIRADGVQETGESYRIVYDGGGYLPAWEEEAG